MLLLKAGNVLMRVRHQLYCYYDNCYYHSNDYDNVDNYDFEDYDDDDDDYDDNDDNDDDGDDDDDDDDDNVIGGRDIFL